jgi:hypothetical protein
MVQNQQPPLDPEREGSIASQSGAMIATPIENGLQPSSGVILTVIVRLFRSGRLITGAIFTASH